MTPIKTISYNQEEILLSIINLHCAGGIDVDPTYSKGVFYKGKIKQPKYKFDINPVVEGVIKSCATNLPLKNESVKTIIFDPPFLATTGPSLKKEKGNIINKRFGVFKDEKSLHEFYVDSLIEFHRILKPKGILIFKCQDKVSSGKQYFSHCFINQKAIEIGYYPKDLFILLAKNRIIANWQIKNQRHARKYHSYLWVFQKNNKKISYT